MAFCAASVGDLGVQEGDLVVHVLDGVIEVEAEAARLADSGAGLGLGDGEVGLGLDHGGLGDGDLHLVGLLVELDEDVAFMDAVVVIDEDAGNLAGNARGDKGDVAVDVGVVGRNGVQGFDEQAAADHEHDEQSGSGNDWLPPFSEAAGFDGRRGGRGLYGRVWRRGWRWRGCGRSWFSRRHKTLVIGGIWTKAGDYCEQEPPVRWRGEMKWWSKNV